MPTHIGFYVHYHGLGHKHRTEAILQHLAMPTSVVTSRLHTKNWLGPTLREVVNIDCDNDDVNQSGLEHASSAPALHYAPLWSDRISSRVAQYAKWLNEAKPDLMVVDVSAEISMLTRLCSIPQIVMRQHGDRSDQAHLSAYASAHSLLAPFPVLLEDEITPDWVRDKTVYLDGFCRNTGTAMEVVQFDRPTIVVMFGRGGSDDVHESLCSAAKALPNYDWVVIGKEAIPDANYPGNLKWIGWTDYPANYLAAADVVVTAAGHNSVMEAGRLGCRFVAVAEPRPFKEQARKAAILDKQGLAVGVPSWPVGQQWPELICRASELKPEKWNVIFQNDGAVQAADHLSKVAVWSHEQRHRSEKVSL